MNGTANHGLGHDAAGAHVGGSHEHGDDCKCGSEHVKHVLAHTRRTQLRVCGICGHHFCRRCTAYQLYGREYRMVDSREVRDCYDCWVKNGGTLADAAATLAAAMSAREGESMTGDGLWAEDSMASIGPESGIDGVKQIPAAIFSKVRGLADRFVPN
mmetsp:Transcript_45428/g.107227  ORF Transcript_45428/g.107227 Transcript_45428/m.107227 type:complete len:157 (+) Transcript_45428:938-1408(+)